MMIKMYLQSMNCEIRNNYLQNVDLDGNYKPIYFRVLLSINTDFFLFVIPYSSNQFPLILHDL